MKLFCKIFSTGKVPLNVLAVKGICIISSFSLKSLVIDKMFDPSPTELNYSYS